MLWLFYYLGSRLSRLIDRGSGLDGDRDSSGALNVDVESAGDGLDSRAEIGIGGDGDLSVAERSESYRKSAHPIRSNSEGDDCRVGTGPLGSAIDRGRIALFVNWLDREINLLNVG